MSRDEIRDCFGDGWRVDSITAARIESAAGPHGVLAWLAAITRT